MLRKFKAIFVYILCWLAYYQIIDIIRDPSDDNLIKLAWAVFAGSLLAYVMGFDFKLKWAKKPE